MTHATLAVAVAVALAVEAGAAPESKDEKFEPDSLNLS